MINCLNSFCLKLFLIIAQKYNDSGFTTEVVTDYPEKLAMLDEANKSIQQLREDNNNYQDREHNNNSDNTDNTDKSHNKKTALAFQVLIVFVLLFVGNKWRRLFKNSNNLR
jgi:hypothetical protein